MPDMLPIALGFGIAAWWMGQIDLQKIHARSMARDGESTTRAGLICGIIGTILNAIIVMVSIPLVTKRLWLLWW